MKLVISQPMFFPWIGFYEQIKLCNSYVNYDDVQFSKGSFTNRVQIKSPEGIKWLTVPLKNFKLGQTINEVEIDNKSDWRISHLNLLQRSYHQAPFFNDMIDIVEKIYSKEWILLSDLAYESTITICRYYDLLKDKSFIGISDLAIPGKSSERVLAICQDLKASTYITGHGASKYLNHQIFEDASVKVEYMNYQKTIYPQLHGEFTPYVSILDLIANTGSNGSKWITSNTVYWREFLKHESA